MISVEEVERLSKAIIEGLQREGYKPFSGLALSPIEAVERLRDQIIAKIKPGEAG